MSALTTSKTIEQALQQIKNVVGEVNFISDSEELAYLSQDYFNAAKSVTAAIKPKTKNALSKAVEIATANGIAVFQRGGGYSYTDAYLPTVWPCLCIDMRGLDRIVEINQQDMYATVEAGCTWAQLDEALQPLGLRVPCLGPQSGLRASIGGGVAQGAAGHGSSLHGLSTESVLGMEVVLADGTLLVTGSAAQTEHSPFFRYYGPDTTGLFCQDSGALGVKATVTLRLRRRDLLTSGLSFACSTFEDASSAMARVAAAGIASENFGTPTALLSDVIRNRVLGDDIKTLWSVGRSGSGYLDGLRRVISVVLGGKSLGGDEQETIHFGLDAPNQHVMNGYTMAIREIVGRFGTEIPNSIPIARRAIPFPEHQMLSPSGQRQLPFHAIFPFSKVAAFHCALGELLERHDHEMKHFRMRAVAVYTTVSTNGFLYEPVLQWEDAPGAFHRRHTKPEIIEIADRQSPNPAARKYALELKSRIVDLMYKMGGVHIQIGKAYPYTKERDATQMRVLQGLKALVDPMNLMNPGALGFGSDRL